MKDAESIYSLELFESFSPGYRQDFMRVPGGWVYTQWTDDDNNHGCRVTSCFIPFSQEFKPSGIKPGSFVRQK